MVEKKKIEENERGVSAPKGGSRKMMRLLVITCERGGKKRRVLGFPFLCWGGGRKGRRQRESERAREVLLICLSA